MITADQLYQFVGLRDPSLVDGINGCLDRFGMNTPRRTRYFLTHAAFETLGFTKFEESLYYSSPERLVAVWPRRFSMDTAKCGPGMAYACDYTRDPEKLANLVYANRLGNGDFESGDGWRFRGRGCFQLTFQQNYLDYSKAVYGDERCVDDPDLVKLPADAMLSAGWFWDTRRLNMLADQDEFTKVTTIINGSGVTVPQRLKVLNKANLIF